MQSAIIGYLPQHESAQIGNSPAKRSNRNSIQCSNTTQLSDNRVPLAAFTWTTIPTFCINNQQTAELLTLGSIIAFVLRITFNSKAKQKTKCAKPKNTYTAFV